MVEKLGHQVQKCKNIRVSGICNFCNSDIVRVRVSRTLSGIPPTAKQIFPAWTLSGLGYLGHCPGYPLPAKQIFPARTLSGAGYLGHCLGYPPPHKANFSCLEIVRVRVSNWNAADFPLESLFYVYFIYFGFVRVARRSWPCRALCAMTDVSFHGEQRGLTGRSVADRQE